MAAYKQAEAIDPQSPTPKQRLAELGLRQNNLAEASEYINALLKTSDGKIPGHYYEGIVALGNKQIDKAVTALQQVVQEAPQWPGALLPWRMPRRETRSHI